MNDFEGLLPPDYGFKPSSTKAAPIAGSRSARPASNSYGGTHEPDSLFAARSTDFASDILGGSARRAARSPPKAYDFDSVFDKPVNSEPVYDKPVYDDDDDDVVGGGGVGGGGVDVGDIFRGVPGIRSSTASSAAAANSSSKVNFDDVFSSVSSSPRKRGGNVTTAFDDLLGGFGKAEPAPAQSRWKSSGSATRPERSEKSVSDFDDLLPGFGASSLPAERSTETFANSSKTASKVMEDPFASTGKFIDPLEEISKFSNSSSMKSNSVSNGRLFDDVDPFDGLVRSASSFSSERETRGKETSNLRTESNNSGTQPFTTREVHEKPSVRIPNNQTERKVPVENDWDTNQTIFDIPTASTDTYKSFGQTMSPPSYASASASFKDSDTHFSKSPRSEEDLDSSSDIWISVSEVPLVTQPTSAPPPARPPPPKPVSKTSSSNSRRMNNEFSSFPNPSQNPNSAPAVGRSPVVSPIDEFEDFARGARQDNAGEHVNGLSGEEELGMDSVAAAMKEAMDRAEAKFRQAKEVREREKATRSKEGHHQERDEKFSLDERVRERQERQRLQREKEEEERERQRFEREREEARELEEREREQRRLEKEKERAREIDRERERARQAVERATREARERAAADARQKAERAKAERAAVDKATNEARERAERLAVQRAQAEARERAAAEAKERAERANSEAKEKEVRERAAVARAAAEARERAAAEAKEKEARERAAVARAEAEARARAAERAAVGRAAAEARERAAADARDRAAAAARASQQKNENDIESLFSSRASSAPRPRTNSMDPFFDSQPQTKRETEVPKAPSGNSSNIKKASSSTNIVDDLSSIFGASAPASGSGVFQDLEGETDERRRARLERHQRTQERAAKALAEKNQRDLQMQREQAERSRIGETLDVEIKRWAAGKEGNLRALLSTLQYVLWPESGWQAVSLTDLITAASVKKVYRKATLCIHPDKVQQKGANLQQKYVAEKVFDLLKEAWNKFNSEELF